MKCLPKAETKDPGPLKIEKLNESGSALPYVFGWLMGVPASVLFLIFMFRSCAA